MNSYPQYKSRVFTERFEDARKKYLHDNMFDVITGIDVVEHFSDVLNDIAGIYTVLKPDDIVVLQTPDADCKQALERKCGWGALKPLEHLHLFTARGSKKLLTEQALQIKMCMNNSKRRMVILLSYCVNNRTPPYFCESLLDKV